MKRIAVVALAFALVMGVHVSSGPASGVVTQKWASRYDASGNDDFVAQAVAVDASGNVYVTGEAFRATGRDYGTVKYNSAGVQQWVSYYNGTGNGWDTAMALALDGSGNVYVTGGSPGAGGDISDYVTVKYNSAGTEQWAKRYQLAGTGLDVATDLAVDGSGNVYVTGHYDGGVAGDNYATVKYDSSGTLQWGKTYNGPGNGTDWPQDITVAGSGAIYVTGYSYQGASTGIDYTTAKYGSDGTEWWVKTLDGSVSGQDKASAVAVDGSGYVYVTGESDRGGTALDDYTTVKYDSAGFEQWRSHYNSGTNHTDWARDVAVDGSGYVYVTGIAEGDYGTVKYNSAGTQQWASPYSGPGSLTDDARALALDGSGNVYVTGKSDGGSTSDDYATVKYNSAGTEQWAIRYNGSANGADKAVALAVDGSGNVYVTGTSYGGASTNYDYATVKYSQAGAAGVGGIQALPDVAQSAGSGSSSSLLYVAIAGAGAAALGLAGAGWYARRRWLKA